MDAKSASDQALPLDSSVASAGDNTAAREELAAILVELAALRAAEAAMLAREAPR